MQAIDAGLNATEATQTAMAQTLAQLQQATERAKMLERNAKGLSAQARTASTSGIPN
jgi:post-segregation antitoxin (ccd killing protein)